MIAGTVIIEDSQIQFQLVGAGLAVTVVDGVTGRSETYFPNADDFAAALGMALSSHGGDDEESELVHERANRAQPSHPDLRFIP